MMITLAEGGTESTWKLRNGTPALDGVGEGGENGKEEIPIPFVRMRQSFSPNTVFITRDTTTLAWHQYIAFTWPEKNICFWLPGS